MRRRPSVLVASTCVAGALAFATPARADVATCVSAFEDAQRDAKRGHLLAARSQFWICSDPSCPGPVKADCTKMRDDLERAIPTIAVVVRDPQGIDVEARITLDGVGLAVTPGQATPIDPGKHVVTYTRPGRGPIDQVITVVEGEKSRSIVLVSKGDEPLVSSSKPLAPAPEPETKTDRPGTSPLPWILVGVGTLLFATSVYFTIQIASLEAERNDIESQFASLNLTPKTAQRDASLRSLADSDASKKDAQRVDAIVGGLAGVAGVTSLVVGFVLLGKRSSSAMVTVAPHASARSAGTSVVVSF